MRGWERTGLEEAIAELAERQHGKISRRQLRDLGLGDNAIDYRLARGGGWRPCCMAAKAIGDP